MNPSKNISRFSWLTDGATCSERPEWDRVLFETEEFAAIPSLGSLVAGWMLIVPKRKIENLSMLTHKERLALVSFTKLVEANLKQFGGHIYKFEHGGSTGSVISCGVDQAHLHIVPLNFDLFNSARTSKEMQWKECESQYDPWTEVPKKSEYLLMYDNSQAFIGGLNIKTSQWFRKLIAQKLNCAEQWDYKFHPNYCIIQQTVKRLAA